MLYNKFEILCAGLFGSSWKKQTADSLHIDQRRIQDWSKRDAPLPDFVEKELAVIADRRLKEVSFSKESIDNFNYHKHAILAGEVHHLDEELVTEEEIAEFIESQGYCVLQQAWKMKLSGDSLNKIKNWCSSIFLESDDIATWLERHDIDFEIDAESARADKLYDVISAVEDWF